jgi:hypothetical protein
MKNKEQKWQIELTDVQLGLIAEALEFTSRFHCGQIGVSYLPSETQKLLWDSNDWDFSQKRREQFETIGALMKSVMHKDMDARTHSSYGVGFSEYSDGLYDMYKMIRYTQHIEHQKETEEELSYSVHSHYSKYSKQPDIKLKPID